MSRATPDDLDFETIAAQGGTRVPLGDTLSTVPPISASTTFTAETIDAVHAALTPEPSGFAYARNANPTVVTLETVLARLEGADDVVAFGSGMGAIQATLLALELSPGDAIVAAQALYGVTRSAFTQLQSFDVDIRYIDVFNLESVADAIADRDVRALYFESIANPLLQVADIEALARIARQRRIPSIIDNTFATPYLCRPLSVGVDLVVHSATKYIAGHGDVMAGVVAANSTWARRVRAKRTVTGAILSPFEAWLTLRGLRTLPLRMHRQCSTAAHLATWLKEQPWVERVYYPGLADHPQHELAGHQFGGLFGGMIAFDLRAGRAATLAFLDALRLITPGTSLGDVTSLILYPRLSSHRTLDAEQLAAAGIGEGLVRLSVGLESVKDLASDLERAAHAAGLAETTMAMHAKL
jgi:cystathionine beta-lyase/cystathionine gamma-synthase